MAQLRQDYEEFTHRNSEIVALGPDGPNAFKRYWQTESLPFIGLADIHSAVASQYHQEVNWIKLGRMPAVLLINLEGKIIYTNYGESMSDIPGNQELLDLLEKLNQAQQ